MARAQNARPSNSQTRAFGDRSHAYWLKATLWCDRRLRPGQSTADVKQCTEVLTQIKPSSVASVRTWLASFWHVAVVLALLGGAGFDLWNRVFDYFVEYRAIVDSTSSPRLFADYAYRNAVPRIIGISFIVSALSSLSTPLPLRVALKRALAAPVVVAIAFVIPGAVVSTAWKGFHAGRVWLGAFGRSTWQDLVFMFTASVVEAVIATYIVRLIARRQASLPSWLLIAGGVLLVLAAFEPTAFLLNKLPPNKTLWRGEGCMTLPL